MLPLGSRTLLQRAVAGAGVTSRARGSRRCPLCAACGGQEQLPEPLQPVLWEVP